MPVVISPWPTGKGGWRVRIKITLPDGRRVEVSKKSPLTSRTATRAWAHELEKQMFADALTPKPVAKPLAPTIAEFAARFLGFLTNRRRAPATLTAYDVALRVHIIPAVGRCRLDEVTSEDHERLLAALDESTIESLLTSVLASASVVIRDGANATKYDLTSAAMINRAFDDRELTMWKVWWFALKANFRPFGSALAGLGDRRPTT